MKPLKVRLNDEEKTMTFACCPFCGSSELRVTEWWDESGEYDAISCSGCKAEAPADQWNNRRTNQQEMK